MPFAIVDGPTILAGETLSDAANCSAGKMIRITVPHEFSGDHLTFQVSTDGKMFNDLYDAQGNEIEIVAHPDTGIVLQDNWVKSIPYIKFRSGKRSAATKQTPDPCRFAIALETD
jgi:hypothetical protein